MLKFIKHHIETITDIEIYPVISFLIFFIFFFALTIYVIKVDKKIFKDISEIPLNDNETDHEKA
ncbi:MAG: CcoQ/FixQ family Cbb3-type cytochrome c oxidase assembly chaperone [Ekhidna sp.]|nr:CcoQ/FixQ family Cbb3-type cytochrome c oxidase assembly chaperone [Ekhidna sp.]MBC6410147.1 CcoQ/FixQ family Cbb3-type cytochrome c oxidase assembly chaperone [Ekhidna sp.]